MRHFFSPTAARAACFLMVSFFFFGARADAQSPDIKAPPVKGAPPVLKEAQQQEEDEDFDFRDPFRSFLPTKKEEEEVVEIRSHQISQSQATAPPQENEFDSSSLQVSGLVWGIEKSRVIINGEIHKIGDVVNDAAIIDISKDGVLFLYEGKKYLLRRE